MSTPTAQADLLIAGAGAAGMMAALVAAHHGASVRLLERDPGGPSNLLVSGGLFPGAGTRFQAAAGIHDSAEQFAADVHVKAAGVVDPPVLAAIAAQGAPAVHFLADAVQMPIKLLDGLTAPGHSVPRLHATPGESGRELHRLLRAAVAACERIQLVGDAEVLELITETVPQAAGSGTSQTLPRVSGLQASIAGHLRDFGGRAVLLATGGFAANAALLGQFIPEMRDALHIGAGINDGRAITLGLALEAELAFMQGYQGQGHVNPPDGRTRLGMSLPPHGAFMVNREGLRFVAEDIGPSELAAFVLAQPGGVALEVFDARIHGLAITQGPYREAFESGHVIQADSPGELAQHFGIPQQAFENSFSRFTQAATTGSDPDWGRKRFGLPLRPPLCGAWVTGALAHTQGGLRVDANARVVRRDGSVIAGLYAAGGAAASISGLGGSGYLPGNGLAQSFGLAMLAARHAALRPTAQPLPPRSPPRV